MVMYPFPAIAQKEALQMSKGNFGLWYNKFIPLSDAFKASDENGRDTQPVEYYFRRYGQMKSGAVELLKQKHKDQDLYCACFPADDYTVIEMRATLETPLVTGVGESHPHEVSMVFDHNLGIPYIPASGVKGIVRFAHTLSIIDEAVARDPEVEKTGKFNDEEEWTLIPLMFGKQDRCGKVVFLDAYPEKVPDLHIEIMNPHYAPYYSEGVPPADYHNPTPIKFLTVTQGTVFIFRAIAFKESEIDMKVREALRGALTREGVGAKTAVGYGRFEIDETDQNTLKNRRAIAEPSPLEKCCAPFKNIKPTDAGKIGPLIDTALKALPLDEDKEAFAKFVKEFMGNDFKKSKAKEKLKSYLS